MSDVRLNLPQGLNTCDMDINGDRRGALSLYSDRPDATTLANIFKLWDVRDKWLLNSFGLSKSTPEITRSGGPRYMLLFGDGAWRYASFGGLNGPPCFYCPFNPSFYAVSGEKAHYKMILAQRQESLRNLRIQEKQLLAEISEYEQKINS